MTERKKRPGPVKRNSDSKIYYEFTMTPEEHEKLCRLAEFTGCSKAAVLKRLIMGKRIRQHPEKDFLSLALAVDRLNSSLNMTVRKIAEGGTREPDAAEALGIMKQVKQEMEEWKQKWL